MKCDIETKFPAEIEAEGTIMDFIDGEFVFVIKDEMWTPFEIDALQKNKVIMDFVYKFDIPVFLLTIDDAIDTSDFIFNAHDNEYDASLTQKFEKGSGYKCSIYLIDHENIVRGRKMIQLSNDMSTIIADKLRNQLEDGYREDEFMCNLEGLQLAYEPFELQPLALVSDTF